MINTGKTFSPSHPLYAAALVGPVELEGDVVGGGVGAEDLGQKISLILLYYLRYRPKLLPHFFFGLMALPGIEESNYLGSA